MADTQDVLGEVMLKMVRLSFADLFMPGKDKINKKTGEVIQGRFHANFLMPKQGEYFEKYTKPNLAKVKAAADEIKTAKWQNKIPIIKPDKLCLRDGNFENWEGYKDHYYLSASNSDMPVLIDREKDENGWIVLTKENGGPKKLYAGAWVNGLVRLWAQDNEHGKRINAELLSVQYVKKGDAFSGRGPVDPNAKFLDAIEEQDDDEPEAGESSRKQIADDSGGSLI